MDIYDAEETELKALDIDVPAWIEQDIETHQVAAINEGGCASGAYMPAVTYYQAAQTMAEHGDDVLNYIMQSGFDSVPALDIDADSWQGYACKVLSVAVELWAMQVVDEIEQALDDAKGGE